MGIPKGEEREKGTEKISAAINGREDPQNLYHPGSSENTKQDKMSKQKKRKPNWSNVTTNPQIKKKKNKTLTQEYYIQTS